RFGGCGGATLWCCRLTGCALVVAGDPSGGLSTPRAVALALRADPCRRGRVPGVPEQPRCLLARLIGDHALEAGSAAMCRVHLGSRVDGGCGEYAGPSGRRLVAC